MRKSAGLMMALLLAASGCGRPSGVLSDKDMAAVVADMDIAEAYLQTQPMEGDREQMRERMLAGVLDRHGITREEFDKSMDWYGRNLDDYYKLDNMVNRELAKRQRSIARKSKGSGGTQNAITGDLWPYDRMMLVSEQSGSNMLRFSVPASTVNPGSQVEWKLRMRNVADATVLLGVEYDDGSASYILRPNSGQRRMALTLQTDTARNVTRIFGHLSVKDQDLPLWIDSLSLETQGLDTTSYYHINSQRKLKLPGYHYVAPRKRSVEAVESKSVGKN